MLHERNYIDVKEAQAIRKEVRRLLSRSYSREVTVSALHALEVGDPFDDEAEWARQLVDNLRNFTDTPQRVEALHTLAAYAYAENRVEFQRRKIERKGYKLSAAGAVSLFKEKSREYKFKARYPRNITDGILCFIGAARGQIPFDSIDWTTL